MKKNFLFMITFILFVVLISGCSNKIGITYYTQPMGATIAYQDGSNQFGISPVRVEYEWDEKFVDNGKFKTKGVTATWVSGVSASSPDIIPVGSKRGEFSYTIKRPSIQKGLDVDMQFALEVKKVRIQERQARQAKLQSTAQLLNLYNTIYNSNRSKTKTGTIHTSNGETIFWNSTEN